MKICQDCATVKDYYPFGRCRFCVEYRKTAQRPAGPEWIKAKRRLAKWFKYTGKVFSQKQADALLLKQKWRCAICRTAGGDLHLDHDHKGKRIRGFLCFGCNTGLGKFKDSQKMLRRAINYLERTKPVQLRWAL